eukprot:403355619
MNEYTFMARVSEQCERYNDMFNFLDLEVQRKKAIAKNPKYSQYKKSLDDYQLKLTNIMYEKCMNVIDQILKKCLPLCTKDHESKVHFLKTIADFYRYLAEIPPPGKETELKDMASDFYNQASDAVTHGDVNVCNPINLGLSLNKSVFYYEIMQDRQKACLISEMCLSQALDRLDELSDDQFREAKQIIEMIKENLNSWKDEERDDLEQSH